MNDVWAGPPYADTAACLTPAQVTSLEAHLIATWHDDVARTQFLRTPLLTQLSSEESAVGGIGGDSMCTSACAGGGGGNA